MYLKEALFEKSYYNCKNILRLTSFVSWSKLISVGLISASRSFKSNLRWREDGSKQCLHWQLSFNQTDGYLSTACSGPHWMQTKPLSSGHTRFSTVSRDTYSFFESIWKTVQVEKVDSMFKFDGKYIWPISFESNTFYIW